jgi:Lon protease-like protein
MAPLGSLDLQRLLAAEDLVTRMERLVALCDAMADDVVAMLSAGPGADR